MPRCRTETVVCLTVGAIAEPPQSFWDPSHTLASTYKHVLRSHSYSAANEDLSVP